MHIADMLALRPVPAAGVFFTLTRRCPLSCAHCSTNSMLDSEEHRASIFSDFAATFTSSDHPELVWLTGGEPLLRPDLVQEVTKSAHRAGSRVALITGLFFARKDGRVPPRLLDAMMSVDHVIASHDIYHEAQVPRAAAFATIRTLLDAGQHVSFQLVGRDSNDPFLAEVTAQIRAEFDDTVPALVARLGSAGRASNWLPTRTLNHRDQQPVPTPCTVAAWPVLGFDGTIVACCRQEVVDGPAPAHLALGAAAQQSWADLARATRERPVLRVLRTVGPQRLAQESGLPQAPTGYCGTCATLDCEPAASTALELTERPNFSVLETEIGRMQLAAGPEAFARQYGIREYAHMLTLGWQAEAR